MREERQGPWPRHGNRVTKRVTVPRPGMATHFLHGRRGDRGVDRWCIGLFVLLPTVSSAWCVGFRRLRSRTNRSVSHSAPAVLLAVCAFLTCGVACVRGEGVVQQGAPSCVQRGRRQDVLPALRALAPSPVQNFGRCWAIDRTQTHSLGHSHCHCHSFPQQFVWDPLEAALIALGRSTLHSTVQH